MPTEELQSDKRSCSRQEKSMSLLWCHSWCQPIVASDTTHMASPRYREVVSVRARADKRTLCKSWTRTMFKKRTMPPRRIRVNGVIVVGHYFLGYNSCGSDNGRFSSSFICYRRLPNRQGEVANLTDPRGG